MAEKKPNGNIQRQIDENLRKVYQEKIEEALPDRFQKLLQQLKDQEKAKEDEK